MIEVVLIGLAIGMVWSYARMHRRSRRRLHRAVGRLFKRKAQRSVTRVRAGQGPRCFPLAMRDFIFRRDGYRCVNCGSMHSLQVDHIIAYSLGGKTVPENGQTLCQTCNLLKSNKF